MGQEQKIDLDSVLDYEWIYGSEIQKAKINGDDLIGLCPFHEDSKPSLSVNLRTGMYHCFACGAQGNYTQFVAQKYGLSTKDAYKKILDDNGLGTAKKAVSKSAGTAMYSVGEYAMEKRLPVEWLKEHCQITPGKDKSGPYLKIPYMGEDGQERTFRKRYCEALQWKDICTALRPLKIRQDGRQVTYKKRRGISETTLFRVRLEALAAADIEFRRLGIG